MGRQGTIGRPVGLFIVLLLVSVMPTACKDGTIQSQWAGDGLLADGRMADWNDIATTYLEDQEAVVGLANNDENLYVMVRFRNPMWARTIHMSGLTVWLNAEGGKDRDFRLTFLGGPSMEQIRQADSGSFGSPRDGGGQSPDRMGRGMTPKPDQLTCFIEGRIVEKPIPCDGTEGPSAAGAYDHDFYVYEFKIPLQESAVRSYGLGVEPGATIGIGAEWGEMTRPERPVGDRRGGGMGGGRSGGMERPSKQEVFVTAVLSAGSAPVDEQE